MRGAMPDCIGQAHDACKPDHFDSGQDAQARDAGDSVTRELRRSQPGASGKIYQASNWLFVGITGHEAGITLNGKLTHRRTINSKYGTSDIQWLRKCIDPKA